MRGKDTELPHFRMDPRFRLHFCMEAELRATVHAAKFYVQCTTSKMLAHRSLLIITVWELC